MSSPHRGSLGCAQHQSLPFQGRWLGEAETERLSRICDNLSVCFADSVPTTFVPCSKQQIAAALGLSLPTVYQNLTELAAAGLSGLNEPSE